MPAKISRPQPRAANPFALGCVGLGFILLGLGLLCLAFSVTTFGRLVTHAWVAGVAGLAFLIPGSVAAVYGFFRTLEAHRQRDGQKPNGAV